MITLFYRLPTIMQTSHLHCYSWIILCDAKSLQFFKSAIIPTYINIFQLHRVIQCWRFATVFFYVCVCQCWLVLMEIRCLCYESVEVKLLLLLWLVDISEFVVWMWSCTSYKLEVMYKQLNPLYLASLPNLWHWKLCAFSDRFHIPPTVPIALLL